LASKKLGPCLKLGEELRAVNYDIVLDAQGLFVSALVARLSNAPIRIGYNWRREANNIFMTDTSVIATDRVHMVEKILRLGDAVGASRTPFLMDTFLASKPMSFEMTGDGKQLAAIVVGASVASKTLSQEHWALIADKLFRDGFTPVLIGGPQEQAVAEKIETIASNPVINLVAKTSFTELASVLANAAVVVSSDTGALHLAVAVGAPTVGLFGVTDPVRTGNNWGHAPFITLDAGGLADNRNFRDVAADAKVVDDIPSSDIIAAVHKIARRMP
jgi:ADP-heptose:LPS heptosyltransferase